MKKRIAFQLSILIIISLFIYFILKHYNFLLHNYITHEGLNLFFIAITVLFPIGMSLATGIDLSKIKNKNKRMLFRKKLTEYVKSFCFYFSADCSVMLGIVIIRQTNESLYILHWIYIFAITIIIYSLFYFLHNFLSIFSFKRDLEEKILNEENELL